MLRSAGLMCAWVLVTVSSTSSEGGRSAVVARDTVPSPDRDATAMGRTTVAVA